jgi:hypothetical protein
LPGSKEGEDVPFACSDPCHTGTNGFVQVVTFTSANVSVNANPISPTLFRQPDSKKFLSGFIALDNN